MDGGFEDRAVGVAILDAAGRVTSCSAALREMFGYPEEGLRGVPLAELVTCADATALGEVAAGRRVYYEAEGSCRKRDGGALRCRLTVSFLRGPEVAFAVAAVEDVTGRREAEEALKESEEQFRLLFEQSVDALFVHDEEGRMVDCNAEAARSLGYAREELLRLSAKDFVVDLLSEEEKRSLGDETPWRKALRRRPGTMVNRHRRRDGSTFPVEVGIGAIEYAGRRLIFASARDVSWREELEDELLRRALHDPLTGLPNRTLFLDRLGHALEASSRGPGSVALLFMDLDDFKVVNDSLGHEAGDALLVEVAGRLKQALRPSDTVARLGGDEFTVLLEGTLSAAEVTRVVGRLTSSLEKPLRVGGQELFVTASIGVVPNAPPHSAPEELLRHADLAMYRAKENGKARHEFYEKDMLRRASERLQTEKDLRRAVEGVAAEEEEFVLHYQPKVLLETGAVVGVEALVRWRRPERGLVRPDGFIPVAEETGLISPLGRWVLGEACRQTRDWISPHGPLLLSVNVSARQFRQPGLADDVARVLRETGFEPERLALEITESVVMENAALSVGRLEALKALGVRVAVDDFGTGYSSLSYLKRFPIDTLKIDRSFVSGPGESLEDEVLVSGILSLARSLGLEVVAEGVETAGQLEHLEKLGCRLAQGYYFSEPLCGEALVPRLTRGRFLHLPAPDADV